MGRPRGFDADAALDRAMEVFWRHGYEGTSIADLTAAMGINRPSLYAAFGDKGELFRRALDRYAAGPAGTMWEALTEPTAYAVAERLLGRAVDQLTHPDHPPGCLAVQSALACGAEADGVRKEVAARRAAGETALRARFETAQAAGDLPLDADPADLARYVVTVLHGMAVQAAGGAKPKELRRVVELAMRAWPSR